MARSEMVLEKNKKLRVAKAGLKMKRYETVLLQKFWKTLEFTDNPPMNFSVLKFERIAKFLSV